LIKLMVDVGEPQPRQVFAGIKAAYPDPAQLVGKMVIVVANLAPRKMRFGLSEGMLLVASQEGSDLFLVEPASGTQPGMAVK